MAGDGLTTATDPVDAHLRALGAVLHGPARLRASLLTEARGGLEDAVEALCDNGVDTAEAQQRAVSEFGTVGEVADAYQDELAAAQGRHTAALIAVAFPALVLAWDLLWSSHPPSGVPSPLALVMSRIEDVTSWTAAAAAVVAFVALRRGRPGRALYALTVVGVLAPVVCVGAAAAMVLLGPAGGSVYVTGWVVSLAVLVALVRSVVRAHRMLVRTRRRCE
ncbi:MAG: hypothetical protein ABS81_24585 [Pseudonocardia sp. SCN 72-86]|nr:MAG: hypothetical protein ABS81_24585 [Pseudonocardia sp. SCN 72-86]